MALGFGFNKTKVLASAEKYVQQGKLQNAITEYLKVMKEDPKDLTVLNTVGDLYARLGQNDQAVVCFKRVGETYATDGFTVKAIAMFKKISKLSVGTTDCFLKLAELYTQQGLYNDARAQYMQVADAYIRASNLPEAARIFQKMLELDPENAATQTKLADLYLKLGKKEDARNIFFSAAQSLYMRGALDAADEALGRVIKLEPNNSSALQMRGQIALDSGNPAAAAQYLESIADLDSRADALQSLLRARLATGNTAEAEPIARKLLNVHNQSGGITAYAEALMAAGDCEAALKIYDENADRLLAANANGTIQALDSSINRVKENPGALAILLALYRRAGELTHVGEVMELLAHAYVQSNELAKARDLYKELAEMEPENGLHLQHYRQIIARLGEDSATRPLSEEEGSRALMVEEMDVTAPHLPQEYSETVSEAVTAALTDSELLDSYNLPQKAIEPLLKVLPSAPRDVQLNHRLASLFAGMERFADAAQCCDILQQVYTESGRSEEAAQYAQLAEKYRSKGGVPAAPPVEVAPAVAPPTKAAGVREIDLSDEWESMMVPVPAEATPAETPPTEVAPIEVSAPAPSTPLGDLLEEAHFYIAQGMWNEAQAAITQAAMLAPNDAAVAGLRVELEAAMHPAAAAPPAPPAPAPVEEPAVAEFVFDSAGQGVVQPVAAPPPEIAIEVPLPAPEAVASPPVVEPPPPPVEVKPEPVAPPPPAPAAPKFPAKSKLEEFALDLEQALPEDFGAKPAAPPPVVQAAPPPAPAPTRQAAPAVTPPPAPPAEPAPGPAAEHDISAALSDLFDEFKEGVESTAPEDEDPGTHYNLGVAFKEMALLDEAIGEFQKVCHAIDRGFPFTETVQVYTLLASCFIEKGVPEASTKWYLKALASPKVDDESKLAIHYELGSVYEAAGDRKNALLHFMEVYGTNIDYRDVAERIKGLRA